MRFWALKACLPALGALSLATSGCSKVKSALAEAAGIRPLEQEEVDQILTDVKWDKENPNFEVVKNGAFELTDKFKADLGKDAEIGPLPLDIPGGDAGKTQAGNQRSYALVKKTDIVFPDNTKYTRFQIVSIASFNSDTKNLEIKGEKINQYLEEKDQISLDHGNQAGTYILIQGKGDKGLAYLTGAITLKKADATTPNVDGAYVFTSSSPFVTKTGSGGKYLLAMIEGSKGTILAYKGDIATAYQAPGTPTQATKEIAYAGVLDQYAGQVSDKADKVGKKDQASDVFTKVNSKVTDFLNGWKLIASDLMFIQPPQAAPKSADVPANAPVPTPAPAPTPDPAKPADPPPPDNSPIVRHVPGHDEYAVDLGCAGVDADGDALDFVRDGTKQDDYSAAPGWRAMGDVQYSWDLADVLFPIPPETPNYIDGLPGYCLLTTGDALAELSKDEAYRPGPDGLGQTSEMWQKVQVPAEAKSIQVRVAFLSQEFPAFVGTAFNDSFFVKFDESPDMIASGNLNDLAGQGTDGIDQNTIADCSKLTGEDSSKKCGEWKFVAGVANMHGELGLINYSASAPSQGSTFKCLSPDDTGSNKCYHGMIEPRIICKNLAEEDKGKTRTLRFNVSDAGDSFFDSALAVDSVVFSTGACDDAAGRMTKEDVSPVSRAGLVGQ